MVLKVDHMLQRVTLSTKMLEKSHGDMLQNRQLVYDGAEEAAQLFLENAREAAQRKVEKVRAQDAQAHGERLYYFSHPL